MAGDSLLEQQGNWLEQGIKIPKTEEEIYEISSRSLFP